MAASSEEVARQASEALARGDTQAFLDFHSDDVVVHLPGRNRWSGEYRGKERFVELLEGQSAMLDEQPDFELHATMGSGEHAVALGTTTYRRGGRTYASSDVVVGHVRDGKITEVWVHPADQYAEDEFWAS